jgi:putative transcriptional regulator
VSDSEPSGTDPIRPTEALLAAYVAGTLSEPFAVLVASHLQMRADSLGEGTSIDAHRSRRPIADVGPTDAFMPLALRSYVGRHLGALEWRTILPGLEQCWIAQDGRGDVSFLRCRPGKAIPAHTHDGREAALVLQGGFRDHNGHYGVGDIAVADDTIDHRPVADGAVDCIIFIVQEAPVRLTGPFGRILQRFFGG